MTRLFIIGGGLFGSLAAAYARSKGLDAVVFDPGLPGAASPAAAGLFREGWVRHSNRELYHYALPVLERLYGVRQISLMDEHGTSESFLWVPPTVILETAPIRQTVTAIGDGWLESAGVRYEGYVYVAAGVWSAQFMPGLKIVGRAGAAFTFAGENPGIIRPIAYGRQAIAFVREVGTTYFSDGTAEIDYTDEHERQTRSRAAALGLTTLPIARQWGRRPYTPGGPLFTALGERTWLATGGRKMGTIFGAAFARRLVEMEIKETCMPKL
jgi:glycine/D-amino acid oxidase-like deaminating enzyme